MILMFITNDPEIAVYAEACGVNRIFVDMEYIGKDERQGHLDTHKAKHTIEDIARIREVITSAELMVRVNPIHDGSEKEINDVIAAGADVLMLPMFTTDREVQTFVDTINGRAKVCLLLETAKAMVRLDDILSVKGIHEIHIGLNDLHLSMGLDFMFEVLSSGLVDFIVEKIKHHGGIKYGIGGIACIGQGAVPAELILSEHVRLGSEMVILSRTFHANAKSLSDLKEKIDLKKEIGLINSTYSNYQKADTSELLTNQHAFKKSIKDFVDQKQITGK